MKLGGLDIVSSGGALSGATRVSSGGAIEFVGGAASNNGLKLLSGATGELAAGAFLTDAKISKGITLVILAGGTALGGTISAGGFAIVEAGAQVTSDGTGHNLSVSSGGTLEFLGIGAASAGAHIHPLSGATMEVGSGASFETDAAQINAGIKAKVLSGATLTLSGGTINAGTLIEAASSGAIIVSGLVANSGTLLASGIGSLVEIASGAVVSGGIVEVGSGPVDVQSGGSANVTFLAAASGGTLMIADSPNNVSAFTGTVSGFGGMNHANHKQFIDLVSVTSAPNTISLSYVSATGSGTLFLLSGGAVVAQITMIGAYTSANFSAKAESNGNVEIFDPTVPNGGSVAPGSAQSFPPHGIDLPDTAFGVQTTLAYSENRTETDGTLMVSDGSHAATIALLGNYMAGSFVAVADDHGGTLLTEGQTGQPLLAHPRP